MAKNEAELRLVKKNLLALLEISAFKKMCEQTVDWIMAWISAELF